MIRTRTQKNRLLRLADFLENQVKDERFDLEVIAETESCQLPSQTACGTAACAIGHMPQVFPRACKYSDIDPNCLDEVSEDNPVSLFVEGKKEFSNYEDFRLAEEFFGLNETEGLYLFMPDSYNIRKGRKTVARRIRKFVEEGQIPKDHDMYQVAVDNGYYDDENDELVESSWSWGC